MRVAIVAPPWVPVPPPAYGGTETVLDALARGLELAGHEVLLVATGDSSCPVPREAIYPEALGTIATGSAFELRHVIEAYERILAWGADVVHDHTLVGPVYASRFDVPVVTTNHGPFDAELRTLYRAIADTVPIVAISHRQAELAGDIPIAAVIHHGLDVDAYPVGTGEGGGCLFLGRMSPDKGVHVAIDVARRAGIPLKIAAKMREAAELRYFAEHIEPLLGDGVEYLGEVGGARKLELLAEATCLLNPIAWEEPFGMVMIEAMACGTPVVSTPRGSAPELVEEGVTGFVRASVDELADTVRRAASLDRSLVRKTAAEHFAAERMVAQHVELYRRVMAGHRRVAAA